VSAPQPAGAFRGGFGGFHAGGFEGGGAWHAGGGDGGAGAWHAGGVHGEWGGTWHADGWHASGVYGAGFHGPAAVNHYYGGGCWNCGASAIAAGAAAVAAGAAIGAAATAPYAVGSVVVSVPPGCAYQNTNGINYYVCGGTWFQPFYGNNGLYYYWLNIGRTWILILDIVVNI
jgi:hypothetical protein